MRRAFVIEVAESQNVGEDAGSRGIEPLVRRRQCFSGELSIGGGFIPAHAGYGKIRLAFWIGGQVPGGRARPAGGIAEPAHGLFPRNRAAILDEWLFPVLAVLIAAAVHEVFELTVGDFVFIDPVFRELNRRRAAHLIIARRHPDHTRRSRRLGF